jgi:hypothetical protein
MIGSKRFFAIGCSSVVCAAALTVTWACGRPAERLDPAGEPIPDASAAPAPARGASAGDADVRVRGSDDDAKDAADPYVQSLPISAKSIGHTSYVLKIGLEGGAVAAYKPRSRLPLGDRRYKSEIAAYRLATALGLKNVPRAEPRVFQASDLRAAFQSETAAADFDRKALVDSDGRLRGALIPWIADYQVLALERADWRAKWTAWLTTETLIDPRDEPLASAISTMLVFDYLTANWDRWSGANIAQSASTGTVLFVDNDGAFYAHPSPTLLDQQLALLKKIVRFSKSFIHGLRGLRESDLPKVFGVEFAGEALLPDRVVRGVAARMKTVLTLVDARVDRAGEAATLAFD